jgi:hypothetical protein
MNIFVWRDNEICGPTNITGGGGGGRPGNRSTQSLAMPMGLI